MHKNFVGEFSLVLAALKAQIDCLLEGFGGVRLENLVNQIGQLPKQEQDKLITAFTNVTKRLIACKLDLKSLDEQRLLVLENQLFDEIISTINTKKELKKPALELLLGGKN